MKRLKRILKWTGIVLGGLAAALLIANAILVWTTGTRLERQLAAIRAAGDPLVLSDLARPPIPPEKNAATYLRRARAGRDAMFQAAGLWELYFPSDAPLPADVQKAVKAAFSAHPDLIPLLRQAAECPDYDPQVDSSDFAASSPGSYVDDLQSLRAHGWLLNFRVRLLIAEGNYDEAARTALIRFRLGRHCGRHAALLEYLVTTALEDAAVDDANLALQAGPISKGARDALDAAFAVHERTGMERYIRMLKCERVMDIDLLGQSAERENMSGSPLGNCWLIGRWVWNRRESDYLDKMQSLLGRLREGISYREADALLGITQQHASERAWLEWAKTAAPEEVARESARKSGRSGWNFFATVMMSFEGTTRLRAKTRALRVLNALQTHVAAGGETPKLTDLGLPAEAITDTYSDEPLHVKKTPQGWIVYSVGPNYRDDGGTLDYREEDCDIGVGPPPPAIKP